MARSAFLVYLGHLGGYTYDAKYLVYGGMEETRVWTFLSSIHPNLHTSTPKSGGGFAIYA